MTDRLFLPRTVRSRLACVAAVACLSGCGSGGGASPGGGTGGAGGGSGGASGGTLDKPCPPASLVGRFAVSLIAATANAPAFSQFQGGVRNGPTPSDNWAELGVEGACHVVVGPKLLCTTPCPSGQLCAGQNACVPQPQPQDLGDITLSGLAKSLTVKFASSQYYTSLPSPYPPFSTDAALTMTSVGGAYPSLSLTGRGIEPLDFAGNNLMVARDQPLAVTWTAPSTTGAAQIFVRLEIAHHGGVAARLECDVPDTGAMTIPASLVTTLIDQGTAGFPTLSLTRRTLDSATIPPGCVEFAVASPVERPVKVAGVIDCNEDLPCPDGKTCGVDLACH